MHDTGGRPLEATLRALRERRGFDAEAWLRAKTALLADYLRRSGVRAALVAVSGGVDSAVALGLVARVAALPGTPLRRVLAACVPLPVEGATNQETATARGREVAAAFGVEVAVLDLSAGFGALRADVERGLGLSGGTWAAGQLVSYLRTPALYYAATLLTQAGDGCVLVGTTNRDEGGWLGFFGKASDGMVDLQPLSDLHKSEVYAVARLLGVPGSVLAAVPTGDTWDGRSDEEMIGVPYDGVELLTALRCLPPPARAALEATWSATEREQVAAWSARLEERHRANAHKYLGGSPAVHLDVWERAVPGGWRRELPPPASPGGPHGPPVGPFALPPGFVAQLLGPPWPGPVRGGTRRLEPLLDWGESAGVVRGLLAPGECAALVAEVLRQALVPVGRDGRRAGFDPARDAPGSWRATTDDPALAEVLARRLLPALPRVRVLDADARTDWDGHAVWRAVGVAARLRFLVYEPGGQVVPHFDAAWDAGDGLTRTLMSVVLHLTAGDPGAGGETRLLLDRERHLPWAERDFADGTTSAPAREVLCRVPPEPGTALVLDHRVRHEAAPWRGPGRKVVLRTDVLFERCGVQPRPLAPPPAEAAGPVREAALGRIAAGPGAGREGSRLLRLARRDGLYGAALPWLRDEPGLLEAGFFDEGAPEDAPPDPRADPRWRVTPLGKATRRLAAAQDEAQGAREPRWLAALLCTGAFCPPHAGHLALMERARAALEARGAVVVGGWLSPGHDAYVRQKCGPGAPGAAHRVALCEAATRQSDWLDVDPWEALHTDRAVNFSAVVLRLEAYLAAHLRCARPVRVVYTCGGDNARFAAAFAGRGRCVVVPRRGFEERQRAAAAHPAVRSEPRIVVLPPDGADAASSLGPQQGHAAGASSSAVRAGDEAVLAESVRALWRAWSGPVPAAPVATVLELREEGEWLLEPWLPGRERAALLAAHAAWLAGLEAALAEAFAAATPPDAAHALSIRRLSLARQRTLVRERLAGARTLSLDPCLPGDHDLAVSRCFEPGADVARPGLVARPGAPPLEAQLAALPAGEVLLLDDDVASGATRAEVQRLLPARVRVREVLTLSELAREEARAALDLVDARDFLPGARAGGLVLALEDGTLCRAPYALPWVRPAGRVSLPRSTELAFSRRVWELGAAFHRAVTPALTVAEADPAFRALAEAEGFAATTPLAEVCDWHAVRLAGGDAPGDPTA